MMPELEDLKLSGLRIKNSLLSALRFHVLILVTLSCVHLECYARAADRLGERQAISKLAARLKQDKIYSGPCFGFINETDENKITKTDDDVAFYAYAVREQHGDGCPGDPNTSPVINRFRVARSSGQIEWLDVIEDEWKPYSVFLKRRAK